jgi:hypothetical protein
MAPNLASILSPEACIKLHLFDIVESKAIIEGMNAVIGQNWGTEI